MTASLTYAISDTLSSSQLTLNLSDSGLETAFGFSSGTSTLTGGLITPDIPVSIAAPSFANDSAPSGSTVSGAYTATDLPAGLTIDASTGAITGTITSPPTTATAVTVTVTCTATYTVTDGGATSTATATATLDFVVAPSSIFAPGAANTIIDQTSTLDIGPWNTDSLLTDDTIVGAYSYAGQWRKPRVYLAIKSKDSNGNLTASGLGGSITYAINGPFDGNPYTLTPSVISAVSGSDTPIVLPSIPFRAADRWAILVNPGTISMAPGSTFALTGIIAGAPTATADLPDGFKTTLVSTSDSNLTLSDNGVLSLAAGATSTEITAVIAVASSTTTYDAAGTYTVDSVTSQKFNINIGVTAVSFDFPIFGNPTVPVVGKLMVPASDTSGSLSGGTWSVTGSGSTATWAIDSSGNLTGTDSTAAGGVAASRLIITYTPPSGTAVTTEWSFVLPVDTESTDFFDPDNLPTGNTPAGTELTSSTVGRWGSAFSNYANTKITSIPSGTSFSSGGNYGGTLNSVGANELKLAVTSPLTSTGSIGVDDSFTVTTDMKMAALEDVSVYASGAVSVTPSVTGGIGTITYSASGLPSGVTIDASTGKITGSTPTLGTYQISVTAVDADKGSASQSFTLNVLKLGIGGTVGPAYMGQPFSFTPTVTAPDGTWTVTGSVTTGTAPADFKVDPATGKVTFTCATAANATLTFTLTATDGSQTATQNWQITPINYMSVAVSIDDSDDLYIGKALTGETAVTVVDGITAGTLSYSATGLPTGLSISSTTGAITGTPTGSATSTVTVTVTDAATTVTATGPVTFTVNPFGLATIANQSGYVSKGLKVTPTVIGNSSGITWSATATSTELGLTGTGLPSWITINPTTGVITFAPQATFDDLSVTATGTINAGGSNAYSNSTTFTVAAYPAITLVGTATAGTVGTAYSWAPSGAGGKGTLTYAVSKGTLPAGLTIDKNSGVISGTPTAVGSTSLTVTASDGIGSTDLAITINIAGTPAISGVSDISTYVGGTVSVTPAVTGDSGAMTWTVAPSLPKGLTLNTSSGTITGTPSVTSASTKYTLTATDAGGGTNNVTFNIVVSAVLTIGGTAPDGTKLFDYAFTPTVTGGTGSFTYTSSDLTNVGGLSISSSTGAITGTPATVGKYSFTVTVTDGVQTTSADYSLTVNDDLTFTGTPGNAEIGLAYLFSPKLQSRDTATVTITSGSLPSWLTLDSTTGNLSGTPTASGTVDVTLTATNSKDEKSIHVTFYIYDALTLTGTPDAGETYTSYSWTPTAAGGDTSAYAYSISGQTGGLTIDASTGVISGTPFAAGTYAATVSLNDGVTTVTLPVSIVIQATPNVQISNTPTVGYTGQAYNWTPNVVNQASGTTLTVLLLKGTIPTGLSLDAASGTLTGTPNTAGVYVFTLNISDGKTSSSREYTIDVQTPLGLSGLPTTGTVDKTYSFSPTVVGGSGSYTFTLVTGPSQTDFPYTFDTTTGAFSGTPSVSGTYNIAISVNDGATSTQTNFRITIRGKLTLSGIPEDGILDTPYKFTPLCTGGTGTYTFTTTLTLPDGLSFIAADGSVKGSLSTSATFAGTISVTDGVDTRTLSVSFSFGDRKTYAASWRLEHYTGMSGSGSPVYSTVVATSAEVNKMGYVALGLTTILSSGWGWGCLWNNFVDENNNSVTVDSFWAAVKAEYAIPTGVTNAGIASGSALAVYHCADGEHVAFIGAPTVSGSYARVLLSSDITDATKYIDTGISFTKANPSITGGATFYLHVTGAGSVNGTITAYSMDSLNKYWYVEGTWSGDLTDYADFTSVSYHQIYPSVATWIFYDFVTNFDLHFAYINATVATGVGSVAEWSGDSSTFASYPVSYNLTGGYYATQAGQAITLKYGAALTPAVGTEPKVVLMSGAFVTDSSATSAPIEAMVSNTTTSKATRADGMYYPNDTGAAHVWAMNRNPDTGKLWAASDLTSLEFGFCRVDDDGSVPSGSLTDTSSTSTDTSGGQS